MARNEIVEVISGIFALVVFLVIGGAIINSLSQTGNPSLEGLISFIFIASTGLVALAIIGVLIKFFKDLVR